MSDSKFVLTRRKFLLGLAGGFGLTSWSMPEAQAFQPFEPFSFAYISDVHLTNELPDSFILTHESQLFLQQLVKEVNDERVDFVMFGGDQVETPGKGEVNWNLFCEIANGLAAPWTFILGDRDVSGDYGVDKIRTYGADWKDSGIKTSTSYWSRNPEFAPNVHLVGLDTSLPNTTVGGMSGRQLEWLKQDLSDNKRMFTIVFAHHPLLPPPPYDGGPPWDDYVIPDGGSVREVLAPNPQVKLVLSGHVHVTKVQAERDIWHVANPSLTVFPCGYRIFRVSPQRIEMETHQIQFPALVKKARKALLDSTMASRYSRSNPESFVSIVEGGRDDRDAIIPMIPGRQLEPYNPKKAAKQRGKGPEASQKDDPKGKSEQPGKGDNKGDKNEPKGGNEPEEEEKGGLFRRKKRRTDQEQPKSNDVQPPKKNADQGGKQPAKQPADQDLDESPDGSTLPDEGRMPADESGKPTGGNSTDKDKSGKSSGGSSTDRDKSSKQSGSSGSGRSNLDQDKGNGQPSDPESDTSSDDQPNGNSANQNGTGRNQPKSNDSGSGKATQKSSGGSGKTPPKSNDSAGGKAQPKKSNDSDNDDTGNNPDDSSANTGKSSVDKSPAVPEPKAPSVKPKAKKSPPPEDETSKVEPAKPEDIDKLLNSPSNEKYSPPAEAAPEPPASSDEPPRRKRKK